MRKTKEVLRLRFEVGTRAAARSGVVAGWGWVRLRPGSVGLIDFKTVGLLGFPCSRPLIEPVCGGQAPAGFQRIAERWFRARCF